MSGRRFRRAEELEGEQRRAAEAEGDVVVAAGAGAGKTTVLAARYVRLIETGRLASGERIGCRNILVLTFTRKAAAEMYGRIYGALAAAAASARDAELAAHLSSCLSDFAMAQISTFDSFAARIARSASSRYGVAPDFSIDEDRAREAAADLALEFLLERREDEAVRELVSALGFEALRADVLAALAVERMSVSSPPGFEALHSAQGPALEEMEARARGELLSLRSSVLEYAGVKTTETSKRWLEAMSADPGGDAESVASFARSLEGLRKPGSNSKDELSRFLSETVDGIRKAASGYLVVAATKAAHPARLGLYRLLDEFRLKWEARRRSEGILSFNDVARLALRALETDADLARHYRSLYRYAMIDEFQDDNELQKRLLFAIAGGERGKLFFVGDEKQSIYLFRGADVSVFRGLPAELGVEPIPLSRNFRSEPGVIGMINRVFPSVMAPSDPDSGYESFEAAFEPLDSREATAGVEPKLVYLELPYRKDRSADEGREAAECEAWEVARIVRDAVEEGSLLVADRSSGRARPARYEDFAVLLRSTGKQVHFEKYFRLLGVPYGSENACGLFSEAVACDLYYALRLALYPEDRNALAAYLRSPFAGLSDEAVVRLLLEPGLGAAPLSEEAAELLPERDRGAHARARSTMARLSALADRASIAASVSYLWFEAGYRAALLRDPIASAFEEHFELVHSLAVEADGRSSSLAAFLARLEKLVGEPDKLEIDLPRDGAPGVRIMTVHKSKGLEFPVVVLPQANNAGWDSSSREAWFWDEDAGPTFKPPAALGEKSRNAFFDRAKERREAREAAELKRLLYVAMTRAESHIIVTATEPRAEDAKARSFRTLLGRSLGLFEPPSPLAGGAEDEGGAAAAGPSVELKPFGRLTALPSGALVGLIPDRSDLEYFALVGGARGAGRRPEAGDLAGIPVVERRAGPAFASVTSIAEAALALAPAPPGEELGMDPLLAPPDSISPTLWGSLVHEILEARLGPDQPSSRPAPSAALRDALAEAAGERGADAAAHRAGLLAEVFLRSDLGRRALASRERIVELDIALALDGSPLSPRCGRGVIDLAFIEKGRVVVVDYKTDTVLHARAHEPQLGAYARAAREIFGLPSEAYIFYLYGGGRAIRLEDADRAPDLDSLAKSLYR